MELMRHIWALSREIGPRGSTTPAEARAADYIAQEMSRWASEVRRQEFMSPTSFSWIYGTLYLLGGLGGLLYWVNHWLATAISLLALILFVMENSSRGSFWKLFPKKPSQNVIGLVRPKGEATSSTSSSPISMPRPIPKRVVLVAHHDSSRSAPMFSPEQVPYFRLTFLLGTACLAVVPLLNLLSLVFPRWLWIPYAQTPFYLYLLAAFLLMVHRELSGEYTPGANDNASGEAAMLAVGERLAQEGLNYIELWCVSTGCEEVGTIGMIYFLDEYGPQLRDAYFINLDNLGTGTVKYTTGEGMLAVYPCDEYLVGVARRVSAGHPEWGIQEAVNQIMMTDANPALARGFRILSIRAEDENGLLPNWHWYTDTYDNIDPKTMEVVANFLYALVRAIEAD